MFNCHVKYPNPSLCMVPLKDVPAHIKGVVTLIASRSRYRYSLLICDAAHCKFIM